MFGSENREALAQAQQENAHLRAELRRLGAMDVVQVRSELAAVTRQVPQRRHQFEQERAAFATQYTQPRRQGRQGAELGRGLHGYPDRGGEPAG